VYFRPKTLVEATQRLAAENCLILSGGTDFYPSLGERRMQNPVVDLSGVSEIKGIRIEPDFIHIGGITTWTEVIATPLPRCFDCLKLAAREIGGVQIQNRGTVAGNLCNASPAADGVPPLLALDAEVELVSSGGMRRVCLSDFIRGNRLTLRRSDEVLSSVRVPRDVDDAVSTFVKLGARKYLVISIAMVAVILKTTSDGRVSDARIAVGSCSATAQRLNALETDLAGRPARPGLGSIASPKHIQELSPITDVRAAAEYRRGASLTLISRALNECARAC
jgi:CO/xanthine dehydrogenase FAD-binding subunit